jgi:HEAT repeat protein
MASAVLITVASGCNKAAQTPKVDVTAQLEILKGADKDAKLNAFVALGSLKQAAASTVPDMVTYLKDPDAEIRRLAAYVLMQIGPGAASAIPQLEALLQDPDRAVAMQAINSMKAIDPNTMKEVDRGKMMSIQ